jgi:hypothetical protein
MSRVRKNKTQPSKWSQRANSVSGVKGRAREYDVVRNAEIDRACSAFLFRHGIVIEPLFPKERTK